MYVVFTWIEYNKIKESWFIKHYHLFDTLENIINWKIGIIELLYYFITYFYENI